MRVISLASLAFAVSIVSVAGNAQASTFTFNSDVNDAGAFIDNRAGTYENITTSFDDQSQQLSWSSTFAANDEGKLADGGWLVLSDGENPRGGEQKYTMFYMDGDAKKLTAYTYNGSNGSNSWKDSNSVYLDSWELQVSGGANERTFSFDVNMADINGRTDLGNDWEGSRFADNIGIWFHSIEEFDAKYNVDTDSSLQSFSFANEGWYDTNKPVPTTKVPEPTAMAGLVAVGLLAAKRARRQQG